MLSVIITCYNNDWCVDKAIDSIKNMSYDDWECIIINDGSTDNSEQVIKDTIGEDNRFKLITTENNGVAKARNLGIELSKGEYCLILDSDDEIVSTYPSKAVKYLTEHPECPLFFGGFRCSGFIDGLMFPKWVSYKNLLNEPCIHTTAIFRRKRALEIGGFRSELDAFENYEFWIRYLYHYSENIKQANILMVDYHTHPDSRHFSHSEEELSSILKQMREMNKDIYEEYGVK